MIPTPTFVWPGYSSGSVAEVMSTCRRIDAVTSQPVVGWAVVQTIDSDGSRLTGNDRPEPRVRYVSASCADAEQVRSGLLIGSRGDRAAGDSSYWRTVALHGPAAEFVL